jgi:HEAT repeat protein
MLGKRKTAYNREHPMKTAEQSQNREVKEPGLCGLRQRLHDPDLNERLRAVGEMERTGKRALPLLLDTMLSEDGLLKRAAELAVTRMGEKDWSGLFSADNDEWRRLAQTGHPMLKDALESVYAQRRLMTALSEGGIPLPEPLMTAFFTTPGTDAEALVLAFAMTRESKISPEFETFMAGIRMRTLNTCAEGMADADTVVRFDSAAVFGAIVGDETKRLLLGILKDGRPMIAAAALQVLANCGSPAAAQTVVRLLGDPEPDTRAAAAKTLGTSGDRSAAPALAAALHDTDITIFGNAVQALVGIAWKAALRYLIGAMHSHAGPGHRRAAIEAVAGIGGDTAEAALRKSAAEDPCPENRLLAAKAMETGHAAHTS